MASRSINKVVLLGNLTRDPEIKYTPSGAAVCTFGLATNRTWTTAEGQTKEDTQFHRVTAWNKLAELCGKLLSKGKKVYLEGRLAYHSYTAKDGQQKSVTEIIMDDFIVFSSAKQAGEAETEHTEHAPESHEASHQEAPVEVKGTPSSKSEVINPDDIPF
jgi:single-strand DNA-binding protein